MNDTKFETHGNRLIVSRRFNAPIDLVWRAWTEAELLDQWWAPSPWISRTKRMDFVEGGNRLYAMCGPDGEEHWGLTIYKSITPTSGFAGEDCFCDSEGVVNSELPVATFQNRFEEHSDTTFVVIITHYASEQHLQQVIQMGMKEGLVMIYTNLDKLINQIIDKK